MDIWIGCAKNCNLSLNITFKNISVILWCYIKSILVVKLGQLILLYCALSPEHPVPDTLGLVATKRVFGCLRTTKVQTSLHIRAD